MYVLTVVPPTLSAAATALAFTPSAVSQQVAALERAVGTSLVTRRPRGVVLTAWFLLWGLLLLYVCRGVAPPGRRTRDGAVVARSGRDC